MAKNLLFITTDQQRWDSLPCYGLDFMHTPGLDRLAREGMTFHNCITPSPVCVPARAAMLTGQYPATMGVLGNGQWIGETAVTWPALLGATGRRTAAIGKMHFHPWDAMMGFDERIIAEDKRHVYLPDDHVHFLKAHGLDRLHPTTLPNYFETLGAPDNPREKHLHIDAFVGDQAAQWIGEKGQESFALWVSFPGPHDPYDPPSEMAGRYYDAPIPPPIGSPDELAHKPRAQRDRGRGSLRNSMYRIDVSQATPEHYRRWRAHYYANITLIDEGIGKIIDALESAGVLDETLIVFTSDHGDALGDHGLPYKGFFYDPMVHVPLLIRGPGVPTGGRCSSLVSTQDLVPLFYHACGVEPPRTLEGEDVSRLLANPEDTIREVAFSEIGGRTMAVTAQHKYVHYVDGSAELYDLSEDPHEVHNLAGDPNCRGVESELRGQLLSHWLRHHSYQSRAQAQPTYRVRAKLEEAYRAHLASGGRPTDAPAPSF